MSQDLLDWVAWRVALTVRTNDWWRQYMKRSKGEIAALKAERDQLRAALAKIMEDAGNPYLVRTLARRALEGK